MIDFIRIFYRDKERLEQALFDENSFSDVNAVYSIHTAEIKYPYTATLGSLNIGVSEKSGYIKNSIHKLFNSLFSDSEHNYNDFGYSSICYTIDYITRKVIDSDFTKLTQLEFGFNLEIDDSPESVLMRNFLMHQYKEGFVVDYQNKGKLKQFVHSKYIIKVYDKSKQFGLENDLIRIEIKFKKASEFKYLGVYYMTDLKKKNVLRRLFLYLIKRYDELIIVDNFDIHSIADIRDYNLLCMYANPIYWTQEIKRKHPEFRARHKKQFEKLLVKNDLLKTKSHIRNLLFKKFIQLINN